MDPEIPSDQRRLRPRFSLGILMVVMFVFALMAAPGYYLVRGMDHGEMKAAFIILTLSSPVLLLVAVSIAHRLMSWWNRKRN